MVQSSSARRFYLDSYTFLNRGLNEQGAEEVLEDLRAWCQEDGGPQALGAVREIFRLANILPRQGYARLI